MGKKIEYSHERFQEEYGCPPVISARRFGLLNLYQVLNMVYRISVRYPFLYRIPRGDELLKRGNQKKLLVVHSCNLAR